MCNLCKKLFVALALVSLAGLASACGDAEANPCRWNVGGKVALPESVVALSEDAPCRVVLDFYAENGSEPVLSKEFELAAGQEEIIVADGPAENCRIWGTAYVGDSEEPERAFEAQVESL